MGGPQSALLSAFPQGLSKAASGQLLQLQTSTSIGYRGGPCWGRPIGSDGAEAEGRLGRKATLIQDIKLESWQQRCWG